MADDWKPAPKRSSFTLSFRDTVTMAKGTNFSETRPEVPQGAVDEFLMAEFQKNKITIFGKSMCPDMIKTKLILDSLNLEYNLVELDDVYANLAEAIEAKLLRMTDKRLPNIFLDGVFLADLECLEKLDLSGLLDEILDGKLERDVEFDYDVIVVGGGSAGLSFALASARKGMQVCVIDYIVPSAKGTQWNIGGTCTNVGCIPKILLHKAANLGGNLNDAPFYGWNIPEGEINHNWETLINEIQEHINSLTWNLKKSLILNGVILLNGLASLVDRHTVHITYPESDTNETKTSTMIVLAVGGRPRYLEFPGSEECITSDDIFSLKAFPNKTLIVGGSYVALELASFINALKGDVTVMVRSEILSSLLFDKDMIGHLEREMTREGVKFILNSSITKLVKTGDNLCNVTCLFDETSEYSDDFNTVILAVGRIPSTEGLCLENVGIKLCSNCKIPVNEREQTVVKNIYALGDCANGRPELSSSAIAAGRLLSKRIQKRDCKCTMDYRCIPTCVFTTPEYACCGLSECAAIHIHGINSVNVYVSTATSVEQSITEPSAKCSAKLITIKDVNNVERLAGFHIVCSKASEIIQGFALALRLGASKKDLDCFIGIHPTCAEIFTSLSLKGEENSTDC